jgi:hypothetical protein
MTAILPLMVPFTVIAPLIACPMVQCRTARRTQKGVSMLQCKDGGLGPCCIASIDTRTGELHHGQS